MENQAVPLCLPNNCSWDPLTGEYSQEEDQDRKTLWVVDEALNRLRQIKGPVCVVSIAGPCRKGKSYILSKAFDQGEVFPLGHSLDPETMGIWLWIVPQKYKDSNGREFTVVLLDSEGIDAVSSESSDDHRIFTLTVLLASVLIYNSAGVPTRKDLEGLDFIVQLSKRVRMGSAEDNPMEDDVKYLHKTFPFFIWLLRDVVLQIPKSCSDITDYFMKRVFKAPKAQTGASGADDAQQAAESIMKFFPGFHAFKLPPPSADPKVAQNMNSAESSVNQEFLKGVAEFSKSLKERLSLKRSFNDGELVTGEALAAMAELYIAALNTPGTVPNIKSTWEIFVQNKCTEATKAALDLYGDIFTSHVKDLLPCDSDDLRRIHQDALERSLELFKEETRGILAAHVDKYLTDWKDKAEKNLSDWQEKNDKETEDFCNHLLQSLKKQHLEPVLAKLIGPDGAKMTFAAIIEAYSAIETGFKNKARGARDVCARTFFNFHPELKAEMEKHVDHLQQLKDYDEQLAQQRAARAAEEEARRRMEEENKRLEQERKRKEEEMELLKEKQEEDRRRLEEQFDETLRSQKDQMENMMKANMEQMKEDREQMLSQNKTLEEALERMNDSMASRNAEIQQLQDQIRLLASRPPPKQGSCVIL